MFILNSSRVQVYLLFDLPVHEDGGNGPLDTLGKEPELKLKIGHRFPLDLNVFFLEKKTSKPRQIYISINKHKFRTVLSTQLPVSGFLRNLKSMKYRLNTD